MSSGFWNRMQSRQEKKKASNPEFVSIEIDRERRRVTIDGKIVIGQWALSQIMSQLSGDSKGDDV